MIERRIAGIPCLIDVTHYSPGRPMRITGSGFGDADPPEPAEVESENDMARGKIEASMKD